MRLYRLRKRLRLRNGKYYRNLLFHRVSEAELKEFFLRLGVGPGMVLYIQSSFSGIGHFSAGPKRLLEILLELVGPNGMISMPCFPTGGSMADYAATDPLFDVANTPSGIGVLPETLRCMPTAVRSLHPSHPVAAVGHGAEAFIDGHENCLSPQAEGSPFAKLKSLNSYILRIGTSANPLYHALQETLDYPNLFLPEPAAMRCIDRLGRRVTISTKLYRRGIPKTFFIDLPDQETPEPIHIQDFPFLYPGDREGLMRSDPAKKDVLQRLLAIRERFGKEGVWRSRSINGCHCDLYTIGPSQTFAETEGRRLVERFRSHFSLENVSKMDPR